MWIWTEVSLAPKALHLFLYFLMCSFIQVVFLCPISRLGILLGLGVTVGDWTNLASTFRDLGVGEGARQQQPREIVVGGGGIEVGLREARDRG